MKKLRLLGVVLLIAALLPLNSMVHAESEPVKIGDQLFSTFEAAVSYANNESEQTTIEIIGDVNVTTNISVTSDISIISTDNAKTINMTNRSILVQGGSLTLGDDNGTVPLTISGTSRVLDVSNGTVNINDTVKVISSAANAVRLIGTAATASISGGEIEGSSIALDIDNGAKVDLISGGILKGKEAAIHLSDSNNLGTVINKISGGSFYQTDANISLLGHAVYVQNNARIGQITGGTFTALKNGALTLVRGGKVNEISGGKFLGNNYGVMLYPTSSSYSTKIDKISGGEFSGITAYQGERYSVTSEISGGTFIGSSFGIVNKGSIHNISGNVSITGNNYYGIYNDVYGTIDEINDGTVIGERNAIYNSSGINGGKLNKISGGVFWGKTGDALVLASILELEPELDQSRGKARFWGNDGVIFDNEDYVVYPVNSTNNNLYFMSTKTIPVTGIEEVEFRYLRLPSWDLIFDANIPDGADGSKIALPVNQLDIDLENDSEIIGSPHGIPTTADDSYIFKGWNTQADGNGISYDSGDRIPAQSSETVVTLFARWEKANEQTDENNGNNDNDSNYVNDGSGSNDVNDVNDANNINDGNDNGTVDKTVSPESGDYSNTLNLFALVLITMLILFSVLLYKTRSQRRK